MSRRLDGARVLLTRPEPDVRELAQRIRELGGAPTCVPMIRIAPTADPAGLDDARRRLGTFDWIAVTSRHAVRALLDGMTPPADDGPRICAVGASTAAAAREAGWFPTVVAPGRGGADALADELIAADEMAGRRVLYPCSSLARPTLADRLGAAGADVVQVEAYQALPPTELAASAVDYDVAVFASPSAATNYTMLGGARSALERTIAAVAIGPTTAVALTELGAAAIVVAQRPDTDGLLAAVTRAWQNKQTQ